MDFGSNRQARNLGNKQNESKPSSDFHKGTIEMRLQRQGGDNHAAQATKVYNDSYTGNHFNSKVFNHLFGKEDRQMIEAYNDVKEANEKARSNGKMDSSDSKPEPETRDDRARMHHLINRIQGFHDTNVASDRNFFDK